jgi:Na+/melibiose symporter-like transporter
MNISAFFGGVSGALLCTFLPVACGVIGLLGSMMATPLLLKYVPNKVVRKHQKQLPLVPSFRIAARSNEFRTIFTNRCLILSVQNIFGTATAFIVLIAFNQDNLKQYYSIILILTVIGAIGSVSLTVAFNWLLRKMEKLNLYLVMSLCIAGITLICFFVSFAPNITGYYVVLLLFTAALVLYGPFGLIEQLMIRDLILFDTFSTGIFFKIL